MGRWYMFACVHQLHGLYTEMCVCVHFFCRFTLISFILLLDFSDRLPYMELHWLSERAPRICLSLLPSIGASGACIYTRYLNRCWGILILNFVLSTHLLWRLWNSTFASGWFILMSSTMWLRLRFCPHGGLWKIMRTSQPAGKSMELCLSLHLPGHLLSEKPSFKYMWLLKETRRRAE